MAASQRQRYLYRRERADGKANQSTDLKTFEKWLREVEPGDTFYVGRVEWVLCEQDGEVAFGDHKVPHVRYVEHVEAEENW